MSTAWLDESTPDAIPLVDANVIFRTPLVASMVGLAVVGAAVVVG
eukprot:CAMPEP_0202704564 /NCGR_PEP_ID=MMETSP1385-20130828/17224_1 /ASSEMBLY_ACC=CAM_ASM_000861 /TAXON_ID=933848 /ORGANISM="Elphidium margaritaceum" /LENGTH=44 /DNA_ID= /DNA_START= /DNA_END= /DNA_ORIENTATION=